jgi:hypothetical protein
MFREITKYFLQPKRLKRLIEWLAYGSLLLDICITIITLSSIFYPTNIEKYLGPVNIVLSIVVILSIASAAMIVGVRVYWELLFRTYTIRSRIRSRVLRLRKFDWIRHRMFDSYEWKKRMKRLFGKQY